MGHPEELGDILREEGTEGPKPPRSPNRPQETKQYILINTDLLPSFLSRHFAGVLTVIVALALIYTLMNRT